MSLPDANALALKLMRLQRWCDANDPPPPTTTAHYVDHPCVRVTVDPTSRSPAASFNENRITLWGAQSISAADLDNMACLFEAQGIQRFFVWLHPGPGLATVRAWLAANNAVKIPWSRYPTMVHSGVFAPPAPTTLEVRKVTREDLEIAGAGDGLLPGGFLRTPGKPGFHHYGAFERGQLIATAGLTQFEDLAFLNGAKTAEPFRRRGAQTALIAARLEEARRLGCTLIVTETLTMLESSFANLSRAGFEVVYDREVYECVKRRDEIPGLVA